VGDEPAQAHAVHAHALDVRTARAGESGTVVTMVTPPERREVDRLTRLAGVRAAVAEVGPGDAALTVITGARTPSGVPIAEGFGARPWDLSPQLDAETRLLHADAKLSLRAQWRPDQEPSAAQRELLARYVEASERADGRALAALLHEDLRFSMPPQPGVWEGRDTVVQSWVDGGFGSESFGSLRCVVTSANGRPAVAAYVRTPGTDAHRPLALDVLRIEDGLVREIVTFDGRLNANGQSLQGTLIYHHGEKFPFSADKRPPSP